MSNLNCRNLALAAAIALGAGSVAQADTWWETSEGTLYFDGGIDGWGVFVFIEQGQTVPGFKMFIDEMEDIYNGRNDFELRSYVGFYAEYDSDEHCGHTRIDPFGDRYTYWGRARMTFNGSWEYFALEVDECGQPAYAQTILGSPGQ